MAKSNTDRVGYLVALARMSYTETDWFALSETKRAQLVAADMQSKGSVWVALGPDRYNAMQNQIRDLRNELASAQNQLRTAQEAARQLTNQIEYNSVEYTRNIRSLESRLSQLTTIAHTIVQTIGTATPPAHSTIEEIARKAGYFSNSR